MRPYPSEMQVKGAAGSVLIYDSRLWHAVASNQSDQPRVALIVRYGPVVVEFESVAYRQTRARDDGGGDRWQELRIYAIAKGGVRRVARRCEAFVPSTGSNNSPRFGII